MEFALPELLSREDILRILSQRQLPVQDMNELTHDELLRVYKTFVMPLSRRPERSKKLKENATNTYNGSCEEQHMQVESMDSSVCMSMDIETPGMPSCSEGLLRSNNRMTSPVGEKRRQPSSDDDYLDMTESEYQCQLSSVTKRIRINSLS